MTHQPPLGFRIGNLDFRLRSFSATLLVVGRLESPLGLLIANWNPHTSSLVKPPTLRIGELRSQTANSITLKASIGNPQSAIDNWTLLASLAGDEVHISGRFCGKAHTSPLQAEGLRAISRGWSAGALPPASVTGDPRPRKGRSARFWHPSRVHSFLLR